MVRRRTAKIYTESKIDLDSVSATGESGDSVFTIGFRYDFLWRTSRASRRPADFYRSWSRGPHPQG